MSAYAIKGPDGSLLIWTVATSEINTWSRWRERYFITEAEGYTCVQVAITEIGREGAQILCSACIDETQANFADIASRSTCSRCGKTCLGYVLHSAPPAVQPEIPLSVHLAAPMLTSTTVDDIVRHYAAAEGQNAGSSIWKPGDYVGAQNIVPVPAAPAQNAEIDCGGSSESRGERRTHQSIQERQPNKLEDVGGNGLAHRNESAATKGGANATNLGNIDVAGERASVITRDAQNADEAREPTEEMIAAGHAYYRDVLGSCIHNNNEDFVGIYRAMRAAVCPFDVPPSETLDDTSESLLKECVGYIKRHVTLSGLKLCARISAHLAAQPEGWQPIETAPKDGTPVLLLTKASCEALSRIQFVGVNRGDYSDWCFAAPVGYGGISDSWLDGWMPIAAVEKP